MNRHLSVTLCTICLTAGVALIAVVQTGCNQRVQAQSNQPQPSDRQIRGLAHLEPKKGLIVLGARPGSRIQDLLVQEGDQVKKDQVIAYLEGHEQALKQLELAKQERLKALFERDLAKQQLNLSRQRFDKLKETRLEKLRKRKDTLVAKLEVAEQNRERVSGLDPTADRIAAQDFVINQTKADIFQAEIELEEFETDLALLPEKRKLEDLELSDENPQWQLLEAKVSAAESALNQTQVRTPQDGTVLEVIAQTGEISSGPLLYLGDTSEMVAVVELFQTDVRNVSVGDKASVEIFGREVPAKVLRIARLVGKNQLTSVNPTALTDRRVVKATVLMEDSKLASQFVNMQVSVTIVPGTAAAK